MIVPEVPDPQPAIGAGVAIIEALGVWAAVLVALFWEPVRGWWRRPVVNIRATPDRQSFHKTFARANDGTLRIPCFFYRLEVVNSGTTTAKEVEVFARAVFSETSQGAWIKSERFLPVWLSWSVLREFGDPRLRIAAPTIPPGSGRYLDLAHVVEPTSRHLLASGLEDDPGVPTMDAILSLDGVVSYERLGHLLPPGHYAILLEVSGSNVPSREFVVLVNNPGKWDPNEELMLRSGVKVEKAIPAKEWESYPAARALLAR